MQLLVDTALTGTVNLSFLLSGLVVQGKQILIYTDIRFSRGRQNDFFGFFSVFSRLYFSSLRHPSGKRRCTKDENILLYKRFDNIELLLAMLTVLDGPVNICHQADERQKEDRQT